jgi:hypothetical protein
MSRDVFFCEGINILISTFCVRDAPMVVKIFQKLFTTPYSVTDTVSIFRLSY